MQPLFIASDHAGYQLKKRIVRYIQNQLKLKIFDLGPASYDKDDDYPFYARKLAKNVVENHGRGILLCGNGVGVCMAANKTKGIRAGIGYNIYAARSMRSDDNTNVLCLGARSISDEHAEAIVKEWLMTPFLKEERHSRRINEVDQMDIEARGWSSIHGMFFIGQKLFLTRGAEKEVEILIMRDSRSRKWDVPGGRLEYFETKNTLDLDKAMAREVQEEIGNVKFGRQEIFGTFSHIMRYKEKVKNPYIVLLLYHAPFEGGNIKLSPEHTEYKWVAFAKLKEFSMGDRTPMRDNFIKWYKEKGERKGA